MRTSIALGCVVLAGCAYKLRAADVGHALVARASERSEHPRFELCAGVRGPFHRASVSNLVTKPLGDLPTGALPRRSYGIGEADIQGTPEVGRTCTTHVAFAFEYDDGGTVTTHAWLPATSALPPAPADHALAAGASLAGALAQTVLVPDPHGGVGTHIAFEDFDVALRAGEDIALVGATWWVAGDGAAMLSTYAHIQVGVGDQEEELANAHDQGGVARVFFVAPIAGTYRFRLYTSQYDTRIGATSTAGYRYRIQLRRDLGADADAPTDNLGTRVAALLTPQACAAPASAVATSERLETGGAFGTGTAKFRAITPFGEVCEGSVEYSYASYEARHRRGRMIQGVLVASGRGDSTAPRLHVGEGFDAALSGTDDDDRYRGSDDWSCPNSLLHCATYEGSIELERGKPVEIHVQAKDDVAMELRWRGELAMTTRGAYDSSIGYTRTLVFVPPRTGLYALRLASSARRVNVVLLPGGVPREPGNARDDL